MGGRQVSGVRGQVPGGQVNRNQKENTVTEEIKNRQTAEEATSAVPAERDQRADTVVLPTGRDERRSLISWAALLDEAVTKPGYIHEAYSCFHNYSLGNQLLALFQCVERGIQPGPLATFAKWKELGRHVKKGERAQTLCMPLTCKRTKAVTKDDGSEQEEIFTFTHFTYKIHWFVLSQTDGAEYQPPAIPDCSEQAALATLNPRFPIATFSYKPSGVRRKHFGLETRLARCILRLSGVYYRLATKSKRKFRLTRMPEI